MLPPLHCLPAMELDLQAAQCRRRGKSLETEKLTSTIKARARALGESKDFKNAKQVLLDWTEEASSNWPGHNDHTSSNQRTTSDAEATRGKTAPPSVCPPSAQAGASLPKQSTFPLFCLLPRDKKGGCFRHP